MQTIEHNKDWSRQHIPYTNVASQSVRMAERSKALRSGRSPLLWAWVRIPLLTSAFFFICIPVQIASDWWVAVH